MASPLSHLFTLLFPVMLPLLEVINLKEFLLGTEEWDFLIEITLRTVIMFFVIIMGMKVLGKRGVGQLSVFELGVIIGLGSAAGDPMFYKDVGMIPGLLVFVVVIALYQLVTYLINKSNRFEKFLEGTPTYFVEDGRFIPKNVETEPIARDEFLTELRLSGVSHLGQVQCAIVETNANVSVFFYPDEEVKPGLPILPHLCEHPVTAIEKKDDYACAYCGQVETIAATSTHNCPRCNHNKWLKALDSKRVS